MNLFLGYLAGCIAWLVSRTYRIRQLHLDLRTPIDGGVIYAALHEHQLQGLRTNPEKRQLVTVASKSKDGNIIAGLVRLYRVMPARGSSSRGGAEALAALRTWVDGGASCVITIDGPRGPRRKAKIGAAKLAQLTGRPIIPVAVVSSRVWRFPRAWDRFEIAKPFARVVQVNGAPIWVTKDQEDLTPVLAQIEQAIEALDREGRRIVGRPEDYRTEG